MKNELTMCCNELGHNAPVAIRAYHGPRRRLFAKRRSSRCRGLPAQSSARGIITRRLERMFCGFAEFGITDPYGYAICQRLVVENL